MDFVIMVFMCLVKDTIAQLLNTLHRRENFKKPLRITFHGNFYLLIFICKFCSNFEYFEILKIFLNIPSYFITTCITGNRTIC